jgi:urease accessory protein
MSRALLALLHLCDSLFPIGSFSHSDGLEAATASGDVKSADDLEAWMDATLDDTLTRLEGPAVNRAWRAWSERQVEVLLLVDIEVHAIRPSSTARAASRAMGTRLLRTWGAIHQEAGLPVLPAARSQLTLPVAFGAVAAAAGVANRDALCGFMYTRLASTLSAAMRLMPLGQLDGHRRLAGALDRVPDVADRILHDDPPIMSFAPCLDLAAMRQQYVHSRLFRS